MTLSGGVFGVAFEKLSPREDPRDGRVGYARRPKETEKHPVYDGTGKTPDLGSLPMGNER